VATVGELLADAVGRLREARSETARLDAEVLLAAAIGADRTTVIAHPELPVGGPAAERFAAALDRRAAGEPVAYIRGLKEFFGLAFAIDSRALIPRPETERLVETARTEVLRRLAAAPRDADADPIRIADVGTGSGAVAISLAVELRRRKVNLGSDITILATDDSPDALELARENGASHAVADAVRFVDADLLPTVLPDGGEPFDLVLANLPYVRTDAIAGLPVAASFEPRLALDGGSDGLDVIRRLLRRLPVTLATGGVALLEIGADQAETATGAVEEILPGWAVGIETDLAGLPRVLRVARREAA
jgi:release factor glutamine methyltransferase